MKRTCLILFVFVIVGILMANPSLSKDDVWDDSNDYYKPVNNIPYNPSDYTPDRQGGEDIATAVAIATAPVSLTGSTAGYLDDYDEVCPYNNPGAPDVVYYYIPPANQLLSLDLCLSGYDTKLYVYENSYTPGVPYACNDDEWFAPPCYTYSSALLDLYVTAGNTY